MTKKEGKSSYKKASAASRRSVAEGRHASRSRSALKKRILTVQNQLAKVWFDLYGSNLEELELLLGEEE